MNITSSKINIAPSPNLHPCPIKDCTSGFKRSDNTIQHFRSHASRIKQQCIIKAIKKEIHHTAPEDIDFRDCLELKDTISEKRRESLFQLLLKKTKKRKPYQRRPFNSSYPGLSRSSFNSTANDVSEAANSWDNFDFPTSETYSQGSASSTSSSSSTSVSSMSIAFLADIDKVIRE